MFGYDQEGISWWREIAKKSRTEARNIPGYRPGRTRCRNKDRLKARRWKDQSVERCFSCEKTSEIRRADTSPSWINSQTDEADTPPSWWINKSQRSWRLYPKSVKRSCWQCSAEVWSAVAESQINKEMKPWIIWRKPWILQSQVTTNQYLKRCWTEHSDSMTSNRIWWKEIPVIGMWTVPFGAEIVRNSINDTTRRWVHEWHLN